MNHWLSKFPEDHQTHRFSQTPPGGIKENNNSSTRILLEFNNTNWTGFLLSQQQCLNSPQGVCVGGVGSWMRGWTPWSRRGDTTGPPPSRGSGGRASAACIQSGTSYHMSHMSMSYPLQWETGRQRQSSMINALMLTICTTSGESLLHLQMTL